MGYERARREQSSGNDQERKTVVMRSTEAVIAELTARTRVEEMSDAAQRVLIRVFRQNNHGNSVVVVGETKAIGVDILAVEVRVTEMG